MKEQANVVFRVPNNEEGQLFLALAKKYLNKESYLLKQRGRTPNEKKMKKHKVSRRQMNARASVPLKLADNLGIYLLGKHNGRIQTIGIITMETAEMYRQAWQKVVDDKPDVQGIRMRILDIQGSLNDLITLPVFRGADYPFPPRKE